MSKLQLCDEVRVRRNRRRRTTPAKVPNLYRSIIARRGELEPIGTELRTNNAFGMSQKMTRGLSRPKIPTLDHSPEIGRRDQRSVGMEPYAVHFSRVPILQQQLLPLGHGGSFHIPQSPRVIEAGGGDEFPRRVKRHAAEACSVSFQMSIFFNVVPQFIVFGVQIFHVHGITAIGLLVQFHRAEFGGKVDRCRSHHRQRFRGGNGCGVRFHRNTHDAIFVYYIFGSQ
mmetsp:Transcript_38264/g.82433  ORF Transcript_38264/g.82433 Transcript_38264/m.82433 type:complete len:227 (+) Transcript_38264:968-1648(+)